MLLFLMSVVSASNPATDNQNPSAAVGLVDPFAQKPGDLQVQSSGQQTPVNGAVAQNIGVAPFDFDLDIAGQPDEKAKFDNAVRTLVGNVLGGDKAGLLITAKAAQLVDKQKDAVDVRFAALEAQFNKILGTMAGKINALEATVAELRKLSSALSVASNNRRPAASSVGATVTSTNNASQQEPSASSAGDEW